MSFPVKVPRRHNGDINKVALHPTPIVAPGCADPDEGVAVRPWPSPALLGAAGSVLLTLASDLPGSPYGPDAAGLWPLAGSAHAPPWEGPTVPTWAKLSDQATGVGPGRLMATVAVVIGLVLLASAWVVLWRRVRVHGAVGSGRLLWVVGAWVTPFLLAAPFASQDVWHYGAEGKLVLNGLGGYQPASLLGHSVWTVGVDAQWALRPSLYGPGALDLSAFFVKISGGRPWVAAECWRLTAVVGLVLCGWGVHRIVSLRGGNATAAVIAAVANPAVLLVLVGGIHNDALMLGLAVAGIALALSGRPAPGVVLVALAVAVKPNALLALGALAWWAWGSSWRRRLIGIIAAAATTGAVLLLCGLGTGGGFGWVSTLASYGWVPGPWSLGPRFLGVQSGRPIEAIEWAGVALAVLLVLGFRRSGHWITRLGWGFAVLALSTPTPEPWYLAWAVVLLAAGGLEYRSERAGFLVLVTMAWAR